ncbi:MAG: hypothetical protein HXS54_10985 [Theionarchaea archaeon]|nr:hypothetical protein [Theionarchaea archaeon]
MKKMGGMIFCVNCAGSVPYTRERPTGVTVIAVLMFIGAVSSFIIGLLVLEEGYSDEVLIGLALLTVAIVYIFAAIGLFQGKNWARAMYLILCALQIFGYVVSFFGSEDVLLILSPISLFLSILFELLLEHVLFYGVNFFFVVIPLIFIWYLTRPRVKEFFGVT